MNAGGGNSTKMNKNILNGRNKKKPWHNSKAMVYEDRLRRWRGEAYLH
jgi:hypothetical protein